MSRDIVYKLVNVRSCARCGEDHEQLEFRSFSKQYVRFTVNGKEMLKFNFWGTCPLTHEPILMKITLE